MAIIAVLCTSESCESVKWLLHSVQRTVTSIYSTLMSFIEVSPHYSSVWPATFYRFGSLSLLSLHPILRAGEQLQRQTFPLGVGWMCK